MKKKQDFTAICRFCGQVIKGETLLEDFKTLKQAEDYALEHCRCADAVDYRARRPGEEILKKNEENIKKGIELFKSFLELNKVKDKEEYAPYLEHQARSCCIGTAHEISCVIGRVKVKIKLTRKDELEFTFAYTVKQKSIY